jgi:hypothetical protein
MPWTGRRFATRARARIPISTTVSGPLVSVLVLRPEDDAAIARRLRSLERTAYRPLELLIATSGRRGARGLADASVPSRRIPVDADADRGATARALAAAAEGELLCLLDDTVEPLFEDWLGHLVEAIADGPAAAGPALIRMPGRVPFGAPPSIPDRAIVSAGIGFLRRGGRFRPRHLRAGESIQGESSPSPRPVPGLSLGAMVVRRSVLESVGGFPTGYPDAAWRPGSIPYPDADLGLRLRAHGHTVVVDERSLAWCRVEDARPVSPPRPGKDPRARWLTDGDAAMFIDRWGPRLARDVLGDAVDGTHALSPEPFRVAMVGRFGGSEASAPGIDWAVDGLAESQVLPTLRQDRVDLLVVADPGFDIRPTPVGPIRVAIAADTAPPHLEEYDLVVATTEEGRRRVQVDTSKRVVVADVAGPAGLGALRDPLATWIRSCRIGIRIGAASWRTASLWGDFHFAVALQRYVERAGHPARIRLLGDWASEPAAMDDATVHVFGLHPAHNRPSQVNVLWHISHPDRASPELYDRYDHVFVASDSFAASMAGHTSVPVVPLHQATDPERFFPQPGGPAHELLYVANYRDGRRVVDWLFPTAHDVAVYGRGWDEHGLEPRYHRGTTIPNQDLRRYYGAAAIVLNDTWEDMRAAGFISNRIYDALASGGFVLSDDVAGLADEFDGGVAVYRDADELRAAIERYLGDPAARRELAGRGRTAVLARHTFGQRAASILSVIRPRCEAAAPPDAPHGVDGMSSNT